MVSICQWIHRQRPDSGIHVNWPLLLLGVYWCSSLLCSIDHTDPLTQRPSSMNLWQSSTSLNVYLDVFFMRHPPIVWCYWSLHDSIGSYDKRTLLLCSSLSVWVKQAVQLDHLIPDEMIMWTFDFCPFSLSASPDPSLRLIVNRLRVSRLEDTHQSVREPGPWAAARKSPDMWVSCCSFFYNVARFYVVLSDLGGTCRYTSFSSVLPLFGRFSAWSVGEIIVFDYFWAFLIFGVFERFLWFFSFSLVYRLV